MKFGGIPDRLVGSRASPENHTLRCRKLGFDRKELAGH